MDEKGKKLVLQKESQGFYLMLLAHMPMCPWDVAKVVLMAVFCECLLTGGEGADSFFINN